MTCQEVMDYMQRHLDGDLDEYETEILKEHTRHCPDCAAMYERLKLLSAELESLPKVMPQYSLVDAILPQLERIEPAVHADPHSGPSKPVPLMPVVLPGDLGPRRAAKRPTRRWTERISVRALAGVVAAGLVVGLFLVTYNPNAANDLFTGGAAMDSADSSSSSDAAGDAAATDQAGPLFNKETTGKNDASPSSSSGNDASANSADTAGPALEIAQPAPSDNGAERADNGSGQAPERRSGQSEPAPASPPKKEQEKSAAAVVPVEPDNDGASSFSAGAADGSADGSANGNGSAGSGNAADRNTGAADAKADNQTPAGENRSGAEENVPAGELEDSAESQRDKMGTMTAPSSAEHSVSPDGAYSAHVAESKLTVYDGATGAILFQSREWTGEAVLGAWSDDGRFIEYEVHRSDGTVERFRVNVEEGTETKI